MVLYLSAVENFRKQFGQEENGYQPSPVNFSELHLDVLCALWQGFNDSRQVGEQLYAGTPNNCRVQKQGIFLGVQLKSLIHQSHHFECAKNKQTFS